MCMSRIRFIFVFGGEILVKEIKQQTFKGKKRCWVSILFTNLVLLRCNVCMMCYIVGTQTISNFVCHFLGEKYELAKKMKKINGWKTGKLYLYNFYSYFSSIQQLYLTFCFGDTVGCFYLSIGVAFK